MSLLEDQLIRHEGEVLKPYTCGAGHLTIGIGHNLDANGITQDVSRHIFSIDISRAKDDADTLLDYYGIKKYFVSGPRYDVIVNMAFCMGRSAVGGFKRMFGAIRRGEWALAGAEIVDSKFGQSDLHKSRAAELAEQMKTGRYR